MEELADTIDYYYDEDFSVPFDVGINEENNNSNINGDYLSTGLSNYGICDDDEDGNDDQYRDSQIQKFIMPFNFLYNEMTNKPDIRKDLNSINLRHSYDGEIRKIDQNQSTVKMSCSSSSSPPSSTSINFTEDKTSKCICNKMSIYESRYSLRSRVPLIAMDNGRILANYHLNFVPADYLTSSGILNSYIDKNIPITDSKTSDMCSSQFTMSQMSKSCSLTVDNVLFKNLETYYETIHGMNVLDANKVKPETILWRHIKFILSNYYFGWGLFRLYKKFRKRSKNESKSAEEIFSCANHKKFNKRRQRNSCSVLELYNSIIESDKMTEISQKCFNKCLDALPPKSVQNFSCQFPPKPVRKFVKQKSLTDSPFKQSKDGYPGIGKLNVPKIGRLNSSSLLCTQFHNQLSFLQASICSNDETSKDSRLIRNGSLENDKSGLKPCLRREVGMSESYTAPTNTMLNPSEKLDLSSKPPIVVKRRPHTTTPTSNDNRSDSSTNNNSNSKRKSVSFDCPDLTVDELLKVKAIPKKWGLLGSSTSNNNNTSNNSSNSSNSCHNHNELMAMFEYGVLNGGDKWNSKDKHSGNAHSHKNSGGLFERRSSNDDGNRLRDIGTELLRSIRQISDRIGLEISPTSSPHQLHNHPYHPLYTQQQLLALCDSVCNGKPGDDCSPLASAVDALLVLLSDGLAGLRGSHKSSSGSQNIGVSTGSSTYYTTGSSNQNNKIHVRLWLLVEETTRACPELHQLARDSRLVAIRDQHHHLTINSSSNSSNSHHSQQRLRIFIAKSFVSGLLHVWLKSMSTNEAALNKYYAPNAFLRQSSNKQLINSLIDSFKSLLKAQKQLENTQAESPPTPIPNSNNSAITKKPKTLISTPNMPPPVTISRRNIQNNSVPRSKHQTNHSQITKQNNKSKYPVPPQNSSSNARNAPLYSAETTTESGDSFLSSHDESSSTHKPVIANNRDITNNNGVNVVTTQLQLQNKTNKSNNTNKTQNNNNKYAKSSNKQNTTIIQHKKSSSLLSTTSSNCSNTNTDTTSNNSSAGLVNTRFQSPSRNNANTAFKNVSLPLKTIRNPHLVGARQK